MAGMLQISCFLRLLAIGLLGEQQFFIYSFVDLQQEIPEKDIDGATNR